MNTYGYVGGNPLVYIDSKGLFNTTNHFRFSFASAYASGFGVFDSIGIAVGVVAADFTDGSQEAENAHQHAMAGPEKTAEEAARDTAKYISEQINTCTKIGLANALHAGQDAFARGHTGFQDYVP